MVSFLEYWLIFPAVFCTEQLNSSCKFIFDIFLEKKFFDPNCHFCMGYRLTKMVDFQNGLISRILAVFFSVFCTEKLNCSCRFIFGIFLEKKILNPNCPFCIGYRLIKMVDFQNSLICRILAVFFQRFFAHNNLILLVDSFSAYFWRKKFLTQNCPFCIGYRLTKMVDFENGFIS